MIDLTPLDVRKKKGDFRRSVRGYDPELVDDFLDMVAERLEELVKQNVALTERAEHLQEQVASYREREKALNEALVTAQQLRSESQAQAEREAEFMRKEARSQAERILEEGQRSLRELMREMEALNARRRQFVRAFRTLLERYLSDLEVEESRIEEEMSKFPESIVDRTAGGGSGSKKKGKKTEGGDAGEDADADDWMSSLVGEGDEDEEDG